jgi:hypothetical protein
VDHPAARRGPIPPAVAAAGPFAAEADYRVAFTIDCPGGDHRTAEHWTRAVFEEAPRPMRWFLIVGWTGLSLRLRPSYAATRVLGWEIEQATSAVAVTVVTARLGLTSRLVLSLEPDSVTLASFVRFTTPGRIVRVMWAAATPLHERVLPHLLAAAVRRSAPR